MFSKHELKKMANSVASLRLDQERNPTEALVKIAQKNNLTAHEIARVAENANRKIVTKMNKQAAQGQRDPHYTFDQVKTAEVLAILEAPPRAEPKPPPMPEPDVDVEQVLPTPEGLEEDDTIGPDEAFEEVVETDEVPEDRMDERSAVGLIERLEEKVDQAKDTLMGIEREMNDAVHRFKKDASQQIKMGTPLEALEAIPHADEHVRKVAQYLSEQGEEIQYADRPFEIDPEHQMVKTASDIAAMEARAQDARRDYDIWNRRYEDAKSAYRRIR